MFRGYWYNFKRGYITPVGTTKLNKRYVGLPLPRRFAPVILGQRYLPKDFDVSVLPVKSGTVYKPFDHLLVPLVCVGTSYEPYDRLKAPFVSVGVPYIPFDFKAALRAYTGLSYTALPHGKPTVFTAMTGTRYTTTDPIFKEV